LCRLRLFGYTKHRDNVEWVRHIMMQVDGTVQSGYLKRLDMKSFGLFSGAQIGNK